MATRDQDEIKKSTNDKMVASSTRVSEDQCGESVGATFERLQRSAVRAELRVNMARKRLAEAEEDLALFVEVRNVHQSRLAEFLHIKAGL